MNLCSTFVSLEWVGEGTGEGGEAGGGGGLCVTPLASHPCQTPPCDEASSCDGKHGDRYSTVRMPMSLSVGRHCIACCVFTRWGWLRARLG